MEASEGGGGRGGTCLLSWGRKGVWRGGKRGVFLVYYVQDLHRHVPQLRGPCSRAGEEPKVKGKGSGRRETVPDPTVFLRWNPCKRFRMLLLSEKSK